MRCNAGRAGRRRPEPARDPVDTNGLAPERRPQPTADGFIASWTVRPGTLSVAVQPRGLGRPGHKVHYADAAAPRVRRPVYRAGADVIPPPNEYGSSSAPGNIRWSRIVSSTRWWRSCRWGHTVAGRYRIYTARAGSPRTTRCPPAPRSVIGQDTNESSIPMTEDIRVCVAGIRSHDRADGGQPLRRRTAQQVADRLDGVAPIRDAERCAGQHRTDFCAGADFSTRRTTVGDWAARVYRRQSGSSKPGALQPSRVTAVGRWTRLACAADLRVASRIRAS